jgi:hypothetical protein
MSDASKEPVFDVYAKAFYPLFLRRISAARALAVFTATENDLDVNYKDYVASFAGHTFLSANLPITRSYVDYPPYTIAGIIQPEAYSNVMHELVREEIKALTSAQQDFTVYNSRLTFLKEDPSGTSFIANFRAPGVSE